jgi:hypothetical protein
MFIQAKTITFMIFSEYGQKSKMMKLVEDCLMTKAGELPYMTKVHCFVNKIEKPMWELCGRDLF